MNIIKLITGSRDAVYTEQIAERNAARRGMTSSAPADRFFSSYQRNLCSTVISGGSSAERAVVANGLLLQFVREGYSVAIIHCGSEQIFNVSPNYPFTAVMPDGQALRCDLFANKDTDELVDMLNFVSGKVMQEGSKLNGMWSLISDILAATDATVDIVSITDFPCRNVSEYLRSLQNRGALTDEFILSSLDILNSMSPDVPNVAAQVLYRLKDNAAMMRGSGRAVSLADVLRAGGAATLNVGFDSNILMKELIFQELIRLSRSNRILTVIDGLSAPADAKSMCDYLRSHAPGNSFIYMGSDVPAMLNDQPGTLESITTNDVNTVVFSHSSNAGRKFFSEYFGEYWHTVMEKSTNQTRSSTSIFTNSRTTGSTTREERRPVVSEQQIRQLSYGVALVSAPALKKRGKIKFEVKDVSPC